LGEPVRRLEHEMKKAPLQNRVAPTGEIVSVPGRGLLMGNVVRRVPGSDSGTGHHLRRVAYTAGERRHDRSRLPSTAPSERHSAPDIGWLEVHGTLGAGRISGAGHRLISSGPSVGRGVTWQPGGFWFR
jgi:hypothetical protein